MTALIQTERCKQKDLELSMNIDYDNGNFLCHFLFVVARQKRFQSNHRKFLLSIMRLRWHVARSQGKFTRARSKQTHKQVSDSEESKKKLFFALGSSHFKRQQIQSKKEH